MYHECTIIDTSQQCNCSSAVLDCCRAQTKNRRVGLIRLKIHVPDRAQVQEANKKKNRPNTHLLWSCEWQALFASTLAF